VSNSLKNRPFAKSELCAVFSAIESFMRAPAILLSIVLAFLVGGIVGYSLANRARGQEIVQLQHEYSRGLVRERELQAQLQEALEARAALAQETRRLQENLAERLRRLEEAAAKLAPAEKPGLPLED
jgi:hypothetical protein